MEKPCGSEQACHLRLAQIVVHLDAVNAAISKMERHLEQMNGQQRKHAEWIAQQSVEAQAHSEVVKRNYHELMELRAKVENHNQQLTRASGTATGIHWAWIVLLALTNVGVMLASLAQK